MRTTMIHRHARHMGESSENVKTALAILAVLLGAVSVLALVVELVLQWMKSLGESFPNPF